MKRETEGETDRDASFGFRVRFTARSSDQELFREGGFLEIRCCGGCCYWDVSRVSRFGGKRERESRVRFFVSSS